MSERSERRHRSVEGPEAEVRWGLRRQSEQHGHVDGDVDADHVAAIVVIVGERELQSADASRRHYCPTSGRVSILR